MNHKALLIGLLMLLIAGLMGATALSSTAITWVDAHHLLDTTPTSRTAFNPTVTVVTAVMNTQLGASSTSSLKRASTPTSIPIPVGSSNNAVWPKPVMRSFAGVDMVYVPVGCFLMGSTEEQFEAAFQQCEQSLGTGQCPPREWFEYEGPTSEVCLDAFWIDRTEVTNGQYGSSGLFSGDDLPRENINWFKAQAYCETRGARLPTEAEWEYAARGPEGLLYPWGSEFDGTLLNFCDEECEYDWRNVNYNEGGA